MNLIQSTIEENNKKTFRQFLHKFKTNVQFYFDVRDMVISVGGDNLWDSHNIEQFYDVWEER